MGQSDSESTSSSMRGNPGSPRDISVLFDEPNVEIPSLHNISPISPSVSTSSSEASELDTSVTMINQTPKRSEIPVIDLTSPDEASNYAAAAAAAAQGGATGGPPCEDFAQFASNFRWRLQALEERIASRDLRNQRARLFENRRCRRYRSRHSPYTGLWDGDATPAARHENLVRPARSSGTAPPTPDTNTPIVIDDEHSPYAPHQAPPSESASRFPPDAEDPVPLSSGAERLRRRQIHVENSRRFREAVLDRIQPMQPRCFLQSDEALAHRLQQAEYSREIEEQQNRMRESSMHQSPPTVGAIPLPTPMPVRRRRPFHAQFGAQGLPELLLPFVSVVSLPPPLHHYGDSGPGHSTEGEDYEALWNLSERIGLAKARGLSKEVIDCIPAFRYSASSKDSSNGNCVVCMSDYIHREKLRRLPCHHDFHAKCIDRWLKNNRTCPVCREQVAES